MIAVILIQCCVWFDSFKVWRS